MEKLSSKFQNILGKNEENSSEITPARRIKQIDQATQNALMNKLAPKFEEILKKNGQRLLKQERKLEEGSTVVIIPGSYSMKIGFAG